jgi:hypothetical protein
MLQFAKDKRIMGNIYRPAMHHALMPGLVLENMQKMQKTGFKFLA